MPTPATKYTAIEATESIKTPLLYVGTSTQSGVVRGGVAAITGSGTVTLTGLTTIVSVVATLNADAALAGHLVTATWTGLVVTLKVWKPTLSGDCTPIAASVAKNVSYIAFGT